MSDKFSTPNDCLTVITDIENSLLPRSIDRALIDAQFNGNRPYSPQEEKEHQIQVNANFLEGYRVAQSAILQMNTALLYKDRFFNARCLRGKATKRREYSEKFTNNIHKVLKRGRTGKKFFYLMQNRNAALTLHGVGALWWSNNFDWMPRFVSLDDLLIPTDTPLEMSDELGRFGINSWLTAWQLYKQTQSEKSDKGWNKKMAMQILKGMPALQNFSPDYWDKPEKMEALWKQRSTYLNSDAVAKVKITTFYHQDPDTGKWWRKVLVRENQQINITSDIASQFLYDGKEPFADSIDQIIHIQFGDGSVVAPFKYRAVRGLGVLLYSVIELLNRLRCQFTQHVFSNLIPLLRVANPVDRDRPKMLQMQPYGVVEDGVSFIPNNERHQIDPNLVTSAMSEFRQLMQENASSFVQDIDTGSGKEMTLGEAQIRLQSVNKMVASMLMGAYEQEVFLYEEEIRRFLSKTSTDPEVKKFQEQCKADGIPEDLMAASAWQVDITRAFGAGDQTLAQQEVTALMGMAPQLEPTAQRKIRREYISVMTRNPDLADDLVPQQPDAVTSGTKAAEDVFGTLMLGVPVGLREGVEQRDYIESMMQMMGHVIARIEQTDQVGTPQDVIGLQTVANDIDQHIQLLSQDRNEKEFVTAAGKELGAMMNMVKAYGERQAEAAAKNQQDPEVMMKLQMDQQAAQQKMELSQAAAEQKMQQREQQFAQKMQQDMEQHAVQMKRMMDDAQAQLTAASMRTASEVAATQARTTAEVASTEARTAADVTATKKKAAATPKKPAAEKS
jgi:hypothetical protein